MHARPMALTHPRLPGKFGFWKRPGRGRGSGKPSGADLRVSVAVLTWDGAVSAVSLDAIRDSRLARASTVTDSWDEEFDRGKVGLTMAACQRPGGSGRGGLGLLGGRKWPRARLEPGTWVTCCSATVSGQPLGPQSLCPLISDVGLAGLPQATRGGRESVCHSTQ